MRLAVIGYSEGIEGGYGIITKVCQESKGFLEFASGFYILKEG
jgi:hypothetical protein